MGLFEKQTIIFEGSNQYLYQGYQQILRSNSIRFKAYATDNKLQGGCCGLNNCNDPKNTSYTYMIMVKEKQVAAAKELISQFAVVKDDEY
jgi:hypothetical protein